MALINVLQDKRDLRKINKIVSQIESYSSEMEKLSDDELKGKTNHFKELLGKGKTLDDILPEAYAVVREAGKRVRNEYAFPVQLMGEIVLHRGDIAEMSCGAGKTLTAVAPAYLNALTGDGVHVITVNEYLAQRDAEMNGKIYGFLGLTTGLNLHSLTSEQKREAYKCDITYTTSSELGFDYLRDNMVVRKEDRVLRGLNYALIDEVDSILIDEARTPLIISGGQPNVNPYYITANNFVLSLKEDEYYLSKEDKYVVLTEEGVRAAEKYFKINNLSEPKHLQLVHHINQALKAHFIMKKDFDYLVKDGELFLIDQFTGRIMHGREYSDGLHQAIQAKEGIKIDAETVTVATITYQNFFRLYNKLAGMTGTAKTDEEEFIETYNMRVFPIPDNKPCIRVDEKDVIYPTKQAKYKALVNEIKERHKNGQPILVGTPSLAVSETISEMLKKKHIKHTVLNAKQDKAEADIVAQAGQKGAVTIATNMAGRGTDIKLGPGVAKLGGLCVLGTERHESRRIDNQLRGRSGRQGDPGMSKFYLSLEDDLMVRFAPESIKETFNYLGDEPISSKAISTAVENAQLRIEGLHFDARKRLLEYDQVISEQRRVIYEQRNEILDSPNAHELVMDFFHTVAKDILNQATNNGKVDINIICKLLEFEYVVGPTEILKQVFEQNPVTENTIFILLRNAYFHIFGNEYESYSHHEKAVVLKSIDYEWQNHIDSMEKLRQEIGWHSYAQQNPLKVYTATAYDMFEEMKLNIARMATKMLENVKIERRPTKGEIIEGR